MRLVIDTLIAVMLAAVLAAVILHYRQEQKQLVQYRVVFQSMSRVYEMAVYRGALGEATVNAHGYPQEISAAWFPEGLPSNTIVPGRQPWIDFAPPGDMSDHPPDPVVTRPEQAGFWYNPNRGIIRARVSQQFTDSGTLELYNAVNTAFLTRWPAASEMALRQPIDPCTPRLTLTAADADSNTSRHSLRDDSVP